MTMNDSSVFTTGTSCNIAPGSTANVVMNDNSSMRIGDWWGVGRDNADGKGTFTMHDNSKLLVGAWANLGAGNGASGTLTLDGHASAIFGDEFDMGYANPNASGVLNIGGSASMSVAGHFYAGTWGDSLLQQLHHPERSRFLDHWNRSKQARMDAGRRLRQRLLVHDER